MIILRKKRILLVLSCIVISLCVFNLRVSKMSDDVIPTVSLPVSNKVIVLDAGHGSPDGRGRK